VNVIAMRRVLHSVEEAASILSVGRTSLYALIDSGQLERVKIGRRSLVPADSIADYVERLRDSVDDEQG
jgi:excisionase family DNA binding protein